MTEQHADYVTFARDIRGTVTFPGDRRYDELRKPWLQVIDQHPALIVEAASVADVVASVGLARERHLALGVMTTGHGIAAACDGGLLLRLSNLTHIEIDAAERTARVEPGVVSRALLKAAHEYHLAYPGGQVANVGVVGYTLGGGMGWLVRKLGGAAGNDRKRGRRPGGRLAPARNCRRERRPFFGRCEVAAATLGSSYRSS